MKNKLKKFKSTASNAEHGIALMFDLAGFSQFFAQPDVNLYVPKYLNHIIEAISIITDGGQPYWSSNNKTLKPLPKPIHWKFLGDGILILWRYNDFTKEQITQLMNRCYTLMYFFSKINSRANSDVPVMDIPQKIRFGISAGTIYKLTYSNTKTEEYIGYCINLASRLQGYCRELGFVVSGRLNPALKDIAEWDYKKVIAKNIKGFPNEIVIVDEESYNELEDNLKTSLFDEIG